mmetsp:Transcript_79098/g.170933  ORF Transcript_79098/g.170933 Transcript_79098/m.170933 type:complete len:85 (+) Transcript_79098:657-911(+)
MPGFFMRNWVIDLTFKGKLYKFIPLHLKSGKEDSDNRLRKEQCDVISKLLDPSDYYIILGDVNEDVKKEGPVRSFISTLTGDHE